MTSLRPTPQPASAPPPASASEEDVPALPAWNDAALLQELPIVLMRIDREGRLVFLSPS